MLKDFEIANQNKMEEIKKIGAKLSLKEEELELYGNYKAKINTQRKLQKSKLILVTSMNPTPYGEGKTTVAIGLHDALRRLKENSVLALREPSLGPVFGLKGGATGGGYAQVTPMEDINLHFTGDFHAITTANNLISAAIDNSLFQENPLNLDKEKIYFTRAIDMNDRTLRNITIGQKETKNGIERQEKFTITAASEIMSTICMSKDLEDLRKNIDKIIIGKNIKNEYVYVKELGITGAVIALLKDAIKPNLVQTLEKNPVIIHGGPFANIAPGVNSIIATNLALSLGNITITEAGFGFDLGGFKFLDIVARKNDLIVSGIVFVVTLRGIKHHVEDETLNEMEKIKKGFSNVVAHINNLDLLEIPYVITLNQFEEDKEEEIEFLNELLKPYHKKIIPNKVFTEGGKGALNLAKEVLKMDNQKMKYIYQKENTIKEKIEIVSKKILHASKINYTDLAQEKIEEAQKEFSELPICIAKTQYSVSDDPKKLGNPTDYQITVKDIRVYNGAGFITVYLGNILTMPGLSKHPAAMDIDIENEKIINIF